MRLLKSPCLEGLFIMARIISALKTKSEPVFASVYWCGWRDSNSHGLPHHHLKMACLPIPPPPQQGRYFTVSVVGLLVSAALFSTDAGATVSTGAGVASTALGCVVGKSVFTGAG